VTALCGLDMIKYYFLSQGELEINVIKYWLYPCQLLII